MYDNPQVPQPIRKSSRRKRYYLGICIEFFCLPTFARYVRFPVEAGIGRYLPFTQVVELGNELADRTRPLSRGVADHCVFRPLERNVKQKLHPSRNLDSFLFMGIPQHDTE